jgi:hypothetical protein
MNISALNFLAIVCLVAASCQLDNDENASSSPNPPAPGFDLSHSDPAAVELADSVMAAMGGRPNWDRTRFISWEFGKRKLVWDKARGDVRIESQPDTTVYLVNIHSLEGKVRIKDQELTAPDSLKKMLSRAKSIWINDSYWLLMPFKLKDTGVTLSYLGEETTATGMKCNVLELTFEEVGDTPQNKYRVYVDMNDNLVKQWSYYKEASQDTASWVLPWDNYKEYGNILLSADRTGGRGPRNVRVDDKLPRKVFTEF